MTVYDVYFFGSVCGSPLWNTSYTWNTTMPRFTACFNSTVLVWLPCFLIWLLLPFEFLRAHRSSFGPNPWCFINVFKTAVQIVLICLSFTKLVCNSVHNLQSPLHLNKTLAVICVVVELLTYVFLLVVMLYNRKKGIRVSLLLPGFWLVWALVQTALLYAFIFEPKHQFHDPYYEAERIITVFIYCATLIQFLSFNVVEPSSSFQQLHSDAPIQENCAFKTNGLFSIITFSWVFRVLIRGFKNQNTIDSLTPLCSVMSSEQVTRKFDEAYKTNTKVCHIEEPPLSSISPTIQSTSSYEPLEVKNKLVKSVSLAKALWTTSSKYIIIGNIMELFTSTLNFVPPLMLQKLLAFISSDDDVIEWHGFFYGAIFCASAITSNITNMFSNYFLRVAAMQIKSALISAIYKKILRISSKTKKAYMAGEMVNLMAIDTEEVFGFVEEIPQIWCIPLRLCLCMYFLWQYLGPSCLASLLVIGILVPLSTFLGRVVDRYQDEIMTKKDKRMKQMSEIINGIKVLKLYAWEKPFMKEVSKIRDSELSSLKRCLTVDSFFSFLWTVAPLLICAVCFFTYLLVDSSHVLTVETTFVCLSLFTLLRVPTGNLPDFITKWVKAEVSRRRLVNFLTEIEIEQDAIGKTPNDGEAVTFRNASLTWCDEEIATLKSITLGIPKGSLVAIVGPVGCGKSSLLSSLLGEMNKVHGKIDVEGSLAYVPQLAWIQNTTLQQNVLFTKRMKETFYNKVITACSLRPDLQLLPGGDMTEIGEKGINLSGGQKQRVSLARAVYQNADIYLLDDPLSAVDAHVAAELFHNVVGPTGMLKKKTRIMATHHISFLSEVDYVVVMSEGAILERGPYDDLIALNGHLTKLIQQHHIGDNKEGNEQKRKMLDKQVSVVSNISDPAQDLEDLYRLTEDERMAVGKVKWKVYTSYFKDIGICMFVVTILMNVLSNVSDIGAGVWLSQWTENPMGLSPLSSIGIYTAIVLAQSVSVYLCYYLLFTGTVRASFNLHNCLLTSVMKTPLSFFDITPSGRILNRFSKDIDSVDSDLPWALGHFLLTFWWLPGVTVIIAVTSVYLLAFLIPLIILYIFILKLYVHVANHLRRLDSVSRSPVYSNFTETIQGVTSIRAYGAQNFFVQRSNQRVDENLKCYYHCVGASKFLYSTLNILAYTGIVVIAIVTLAVLERNTLGVGLMALTLTYCIQLTGGLSMLVRMGAFLEQYIVGVERIKEYTSLQPEASWTINETKPSSCWPSDGAVEILNYTTRYRDDLSPVLKDVTLTIDPGTKVGIVGRTGAGKSSLVLSLFRIIEPISGKIYIDGVDISKIGVHDLRSKLTVIPQDPVLFAGSLRMNLDPWGAHSDEAVWTALEHSHLKQYMLGLAEGLNYTVLEGGENLSAGQRQLVCLARALLRKSKILLLDEATASVDLDTDSLIQDTVREAFSDCTVITIAHRLNTILKSNRVFVFSEGQLIEEGSPDDLLSEPSSHFYLMAKDAGLV